MYVHASRALSDNTCLVKGRLVVLESTFAGLGLGLELKGLAYIRRGTTFYSYRHPAMYCSR